MRIAGLLLDLEGVLYEGGEAIPGAVDAVARIARTGLPVRYLTNTTTRPRSAIAQRLRAMGIDLDPGHLFTPAAAAAGTLRAAEARRIHLAAAPELAEDFAAFDLADAGPVDAAVMGDIHRGYDWDRVNALFAMVRDGALLVALHKNRYCRREGDIALDLGPFVAAVEYAAGVEATVVGKPAAAFFAEAVADMGAAPESVVMVGDDIEADIGGAQAAGLKAVQVETGKFTAADRRHPSIRPWRRIPSIADLPALIETA